MNIAIIGYGKMGHEIEKICRERGHNIVCTIDVGEESKFESDEFKNAAVAIEFSSPESALNNYKRAFAANVPVVSGTTGWLDNIDEVKQACEKEKIHFYHPSPVFCTDNAAMIGVAGYYAYMNGTRHGLDLNAVPNLKIGQRL